MLTLSIDYKRFVFQVSLDPEDFLVWMLLLEKRVFKEQMGFLESLVGKDSKEIKVHWDTEGRMVFLGRKVSMNYLIFPRTNL